MPLTAGARVGDYVILAPLGKGGMGEVYRARHEKLRREVAVKVLPQHMAGDDSALARFEREAQAVASLSHPNILAIHDFGRSEGVTFAVTELLEGETLRERLSVGPLPHRKLFPIAVQIAEGLAAAHEKGIVHRDLKPENLFITRDGQVKILDFGLAKQGAAAPMGSEASEAATRTEATEAGTVLGTVGYMAPEQVRGLPADARSDIFAFGAILYEMITGERAFRGQSPADTMSAILKEDPPLLARPTADLSSPLARIVRRCLEKSPEERFQSVRDVRFALDDASAAGGSAAPVDDTPAVFASRRRSRALLWAAAAAGVLAVALAILLAARDRKPGTSGVPKIQSLAVLPLENLSRDPEQEYFADGMTEALITSLAQIGALRVTSRTSVMHYKSARKPLPEIGRELNVDAVVEGSVLRAGDRVRITTQLIHAATDRHLWAEDYERPLRDVLSLQSEVARAIAREIEIRLTPQQVQRLAARPVDPEAYEAYLKGRYFWNKRSSEGLKQAIAFFERATSKDPTYAPAHAGLADCYTILGVRRLLPPAEAFPRARKAAEKSVQLDESLAEGHTSLGAVLWNELDYAGAEREFRRAIELNPSYATARQWYGEWLTSLGRHQEALAELRRAVESDPLSLIVRTSLAGTHYFARDYETAAEQLRKVLEMDQGFLAARYYLGGTLLAQGKPREAIAEFLKFEQDGSIPSPIVSVLGFAHAAAGESAKARELFEDLRERSRRGYISPLDFAILHTGLGEKDQAFARLREACAERAGNVGEVGADPLFDSLRSDPRFAEILRCLGLEK